ncbi:MAG: hypothetical protein WC477_04105 [Patescibacteria group bacterium]
MHCTRIVICHPEAMGDIKWIHDHSIAAIQSRVDDARRQGVFITQLSRAEIRTLNRFTQDSLSLIFDRSARAQGYGREYLVYGFRKRAKPNATLVSKLRSCQVVDPKYQTWLQSFIRALEESPGSHRIFVC